MSRPVVVTGVGLLSPLGNSVEEFQHARLQARPSLRHVDWLELQGKPARLAARLKHEPVSVLGTERNLRPLDRISQMATAAVALALQDAGLTTRASLEEPIGLVLGTTFSGVRTIAEFDRRGLERGPAHVSPFDFANTVINAAAGQAAIWHGLSGLNSTLCAGPAAGLQALGYAADLIRSGQAEVLLAGGADELSAETYAGFEQAGWLNGALGRACAVPFSRQRDGFAPSEGAAFLVLEERTRALARGARILAELAGFGCAYDAGRGDDERRGAAALARAIEAALGDAGLDAQQIDALGCGASGSPRFDALEAQALTLALAARAREVPATAVKSAVGEALGASGVFQIVDLLAALAGGPLAGVTSLLEPDATIELQLVTDARSAKVARALVTANGFDGGCAALVVARAA